MSIAFDAAANSGYQAAQSTYTANITIAGRRRGAEAWGLELGWGCEGRRITKQKEFYGCRQ